MTTGIYNIDDKIWDSWSQKRYMVNNLLVLSFHNKKTIKYAGANFRDIVGLSIDPRKGSMEFSRGGSKCSFSIDKSPDKILIEKEGTDISIRIL